MHMSGDALSLGLEWFLRLAPCLVNHTMHNKTSPARLTRMCGGLILHYPGQRDLLSRIRSAGTPAVNTCPLRLSGLVKDDDHVVNGSHRVLVLARACCGRSGSMDARQTGIAVHKCGACCGCRDCSDNRRYQMADRRRRALVSKSRSADPFCCASHARWYRQVAL